jgi:hypothetical protein
VEQPTGSHLGRRIHPFKVAEANPAKLSRVNHSRNGISGDIEHPLESCMHEEWFIIINQELVELDPVLGMKSRDAEKIRDDFGDSRFN